ncbi:9790_t:CDS:1, partial [Rhizophagus irregularis]
RSAVAEEKDYKDEKDSYDYYPDSYDGKDKYDDEYGYDDKKNDHKDDKKEKYY